MIMETYVCVLFEFCVALLYVCVVNIDSFPWWKLGWAVHHSTAQRVALKPYSRYAWSGLTTLGFINGEILDRI